jgi:hypothetical protein
MYSHVKGGKLSVSVKHSHKASIEDHEKTEDGSATPRHRLFIFLHRQECDEGIKLIEMLQYADSL